MNKKIFLLIFLPVFWLYARTAPDTVYWQDAGIYLAGLKSWGIVYPPGFPLYMILAGIWSKLFSGWGSFAYVVHLFSGFCGAAAAGVVGLIAFELIPKNKTVSIFGPLVAGWAAGLSYSLWAQSINAEVYSLAGLLMMLTIWFVLRAKFRWAAVVWGLSFGVHPVTFVLAPIMLWHVRQERLKLALIFIFFGLISYIYMPIRSAANPAYMWSKIDSLSGFVGAVTGVEYFTRDRAINLFDYKKIMGYPWLFIQEFYALILVGIMGFRQMSKKIKKMWWILFGVTYFIVSIYESGTEYNFWLIPVYLFFAIGVGIGANALKSRWMKGVVLGALFLQLGLNWRYLNRSRYTTAQEFGQNLLSRVSENGIFITVGDQESAIPQYLQAVEAYRKDVVMVWESTLTITWKKQRFIHEHPDIFVPDEPDFTKFVEENLKLGKRIYIVKRGIVPIDDKFFYYPVGTIWRISLNNDEAINLDDWKFSFSDPRRYTRPEKAELTLKGEEMRRVRYSEQAKLFELQAKKNLGDLCLEKADGGKYLKVGIEQWQGKRLLYCARDAYMEMFEIQPDFYNEDVFLRLSRVYGGLEMKDEAKKYYTEVLRRKNAK